MFGLMSVNSSKREMCVGQYEAGFMLDWVKWRSSCVHWSCDHLYEYEWQTRAGSGKTYWSKQASKDVGIKF